MTRITREIKQDEKKHRKLLGNVLKQRRKQAEMTQKEVADLAGLEYYTMVSQIETGVTRIPYSRVFSLAHSLRIEPQALARTLVSIYEPALYKIIWGTTTAEKEIYALAKPVT